MTVAALEALPAVESVGAETSTVTSGSVGGSGQLAPAIKKGTGLSTKNAPNRVGGSSRQSKGSSRRSSGTKRKSSSRRRSGGLPAKLSIGGGTNAHKIVVAEFILCVVVIGVNPIMTRPPKTPAERLRYISPTIL